MAPATDDDRLVDLLSRGDAETAERLFAAYAPYLRAIVRGHLAERFRSKFDTSDVVQSVWVQVVRKVREGTWRVGSEAELRGLLATITRRRLITQVRHHAAAADRERPLGEGVAGGPSPDQPRPSEVAQADELWQRMLAVCPPESHDVLRLRRQGYSPAEIAAQTGMHAGSVRRILRRVARDVADLSAARPDDPTE